MAGRRRKNTVAGSKKESPKTQNTLQETNVSTDKEATKADVKKQAEDVNEKKTADAKIVEDKKVQTETKAADETFKESVEALKGVIESRQLQRLRQTKKLMHQKREEESREAKISQKSSLLLKFIYSIVEKKQTRMLL